VWCADFKGWFRTADGERIDPLTITDAYSRFLLRCQAVEKTDTPQARAIFEAAFREYGMPRAIRTDNGAPFASSAVGGLSRLSVWWMKLGIVAERIEAGHPKQNGRHERMHRTLKQETASPAAANRRAQQRVFDRFRGEYNE
jgi:transposase InsO family protein